MERALLRFVLARGTAPESRGLQRAAHGEVAGSAAAVVLATGEHPAALVALSTIRSVARWVQPRRNKLCKHLVLERFLHGGVGG